MIPAAALTLSLGMGSCTSDLDVTPINPQQTMELDQDALLNKIYSSFCLTGQEGPSGNGDIEDADEGRSEFYRKVWELNEFTSDEGHWIWFTDTGIPDLIHNTYGAGSVLSDALYARIYFSITLCNFYLQQTEGLTDAENVRRRAEVRFIRAMQYYYVMDLYGKATFTVEVSSTPGVEYNRSQYFDFIETELLAAAEDMAEPGQSGRYGRVDKVAAWLLLSRLYLNAETYTGSARWDDAMTYADRVINNGYYHLNTTAATNPKTGEKYTAYQMLFLSDNDTNGAQYENIFPILQDGVNTNTYGAMNFLVLSNYSSDMDANVPSGTNTSWGKCARVKRQLLDKFYTGNIPNGNSVEVMTSAANDDRALFYGEGFTPDIIDESDNTAGFGCVKFRNVRSDGEPNTVVEFVNTDLPLLRIAEAYLTYAEASTRKSGVNAQAKEKIDALRNRAHASLQSSYSLNDICDEWSREFWFEGRRRMDLQRFGKYAGQSEYTWEWMGGVYEGTQIPAYRSVFAIPENEIANNTNIHQNPNY